MFTSRVVRKCLVPLAAAVVVEVQHKPSKEGNTYCRPSELPIYTPETVPPPPCPCEEDQISGFVEDAFRSTRLTLTKYSEEFQAYKQVGLDQLEKSKDNVEWIVNYLQEENNTLPKAGAIGIGALTGLIFGLRGGLFKRTVYAATGALSMSALCYPKEAAIYTETGLVEAKKYLTIAYNFVYGVKKDDAPLELPSLPKLPSSLAEAWHAVKSTATSFVSDKKDSEQKVVEQVTKSN